MKLYKVISCSAEQLESSLNGAAKEGWSVIYNSLVINDKILAILEMQQEIDTIGDDAQLASIDMQNMIQKQQQLIQMMSNISKVLHDTAMAIVRRIG